MTAAFSLLFFSILAATQLTFISPAITKVKAIIGVICVHFLLALTTDILIGYHQDARIILLICQLFYAMWGLFLFIGFMVLFGRLYRASLSRQKLLCSHLGRKAGGKRRLTLSLAVIMTFLCSLYGLLTVLLLIYGMADVYGVISYHQPEPWKWFAYHTAFRIIELAIASTISYIATQPFRYEITKFTIKFSV